ncbi:hypothetical protein ACLBWT_04575 [Paenibacillus sp. D51F]
MTFTVSFRYDYDKYSLPDEGKSSFRSCRIREPGKTVQAGRGRGTKMVPEDSAPNGSSLALKPQGTDARSRR